MSADGCRGRLSESKGVFRLEDERAQNEGDHEQAAESQAKQTSHLSIVHSAEATQSRPPMFRRCRGCHNGNLRPILNVESR
jgi:hypothetical protein